MSVFLRFVKQSDAYTMPTRPDRHSLKIMMRRRSVQYSRTPATGLESIRVVPRPKYDWSAATLFEVNAV